MASEAPVAAESHQAEDDITAEGRAATVLDPAIQLRLDHAISKLKASDFEGAADLLSDLMRESADRYGQLCHLIAPIYFHYGDALLAIAQSKSDALGDGAGATAGEGEGDEDDEDEDVTGGDGGGGGGVSAAAATSAAAAGEEDLAEKEAEDEADDGTIAFECLDTARYIYERQPRNETRDAALHKVRIRLGDAFVEAEEFTAAAAEYRAALLLLDGAPPTDRRLPAVLEAMGQALMHEASSKAAQGDEPLRKRLLAQASVHYKGAAEAMVAIVRATATQHGFAGLAAAVAAEVEAGALTCEYPAGVTTTAVGLAQQQQPAGGAAGGAAAAAAPGAPGEPEIRVFQTAFARSRPEADATSASVFSQLGDSCEIIDDLLQRLTDIAADVGVSVARIMSEAGARVAASSSSGAAGGGAASGAFDAPSSAAAGAAVAVVPIRRKPAAAASSEAPVPEAPRSAAAPSAAAAAAAAAAPATELPAAAAAPALAGSKRAREEGAGDEEPEEGAAGGAAAGEGRQLSAAGTV